MTSAKARQEWWEYLWAWKSDFLKELGMMSEWALEYWLGSPWLSRTRGYEWKLALGSA